MGDREQLQLIELIMERKKLDYLATATIRRQNINKTKRPGWRNILKLTQTLCLNK